MLHHNIISHNLNPVKKLRIALIFGGRSGEHEVSLVSARSVMAAMNPKKYRVTPIKISKNGEWTDRKDALHFLKKNFDAAFSALHGPFGEDGTIQGMLEMAGIPYVGCGVLASSLAMDKFMSKIIFKAHGLPQVNFLHTTREEIKQELPKIKKLVQKRIGFPCFVKPSNLGSSVGISKVKKPNELAAALLRASVYDSSVLIEEAVDAREIECSVLGNDKPIASVAGEIVPNREFYDYFAKYVDNASKLFIPAKIAPQKMREVQRLSLAAYRALQCSGMARADFFMDRKTGKLYLNEVNTIPGFTSISMYPKLWQASGISYPKLIDRLIELAIERHKERNKSKFSFESGSEWYKNSSKVKGQNHM